MRKCPACDQAMHLEGLQDGIETWRCLVCLHLLLSTASRYGLPANLREC